MKQSSRIVLLLLCLQAVATIFLWSLDALNQVSEGTFALFLAIDLLGFAMISYVYRSEKNSNHPSRNWLLVGCGMILILLFSSLYFV